LKNGTVMAWGGNFSGQLGNGTETESHVPVVVKDLSGVVAIAAGGEVNLALLGNGTVMAWGDNRDPQLDNGTTTAISDVPARKRRPHPNRLLRAKTRKPRVVLGRRPEGRPLPVRSSWTLRRSRSESIKSFRAQATLPGDCAPDGNDHRSRDARHHTR
jgi:hypothetical protein